MKRFLPFLAALGDWANQPPINSGKEKTELRTKDLVAGAMCQPDLGLIDPHTKFIFDHYLPLHLDPSIAYHEQNRVALSAFVQSLYTYCFQLSHKERIGDFLQNNIGMPLTLYLVNLPQDKFSKVYESVMAGEPSDKKSQSEYVVEVVEEVMKLLRTKFRHHITGELTKVTASRTSTSPARKVGG